ncbi:hypothetical protein MQM1_051 [Aeromonas phage vB_AsaP_MQM1]|nr:hypothetical protein MQM1_051 [Aeromonas phage vB_AsaP_MQM1]
MSNVQQTIRSLMTQFNNDGYNPARRALLSKMRSAGMTGLVCETSQNSNQYTLYSQGADGDVRYFSVARDGEGNKSYTGNWGQFRAIRADMQDGTVVMLDAAKQSICAPAKLVEVSEKDIEAIAKKTTDEVLQQTQAVLTEITRLDDELAYQHVLIGHLRSVVQERIALVMG